MPLRPTEFTVLPKSCIKKENGKFYITVRRSSVKGYAKGLNNKKPQKVVPSISRLPKYDLNEDYVKFTYEINEEIYNLIKGYIDISDDIKFENPYCEKYDLMFNNKVYLHYRKKFATQRGKTLSDNDDIFKKDSLDTILDRFYKNIIGSYYGLEVVKNNIDEDRIYNSKAFELKQICKILLGDTRHIALINMSMSDINPILIRDFVFHRNINTTYHYIENTKKFVKCMTYMKYKKLLKSKNSDGFIYQLSNQFNAANLLAEMEGSLEYAKMGNGRCYSKKFIQGKIDDCISDSFDIGDCDNCPHFERDTPISEEELQDKIRYHEEKVDKESRYFTYVLKQCCNKGDVANLSKASLRIKTAISQQKEVLEMAIKQNLT